MQLFLCFSALLPLSTVLFIYLLSVVSPLNFYYFSHRDAEMRLANIATVMSISEDNTMDGFVKGVYIV